jgi:hypothetical protein
MIDGLKFGINSIAMALARVEPGFSSSSHGSIIALCFYYLEYALYQRPQTTVNLECLGRNKPIKPH